VREDPPESGDRLDVVYMAWCGECGAADYEVTPTEETVSITCRFLRALVDPPLRSVRRSTPLGEIDTLDRPH